MANKTVQPNTCLNPESASPESEPESIQSFGCWVKAWREYRGISLSEMARRAGWDAQFQNLLEKELRRKKDGSPPMPREETVRIISRVLNAPERDALLAAGYAPPDLRQPAYLSAPRRSPEGNFVLLHVSDVHLTSSEHRADQSSKEGNSSSMTDLLHRQEQKVEAVWGRLAEYDRRFQKLEAEVSAKHIVSRQPNLAHRATLSRNKSKKVLRRRIVSDLSRRNK